MNKTQKAEMATLLKDKFSKAGVAIFADYKGLKATEMDVLRAKVREAKGEVKVIKNNIARVIVKDGSFGDDAKILLDKLAGPTFVAFAYDDYAKIAKVVYDFSKENEALTLRDGLMERKIINAQEIEVLAKLPSKNELLAQLLSVMNGPARGFVSVLAAVPRSLVTVLSAIEKKKGEAE